MTLRRKRVALFGFVNCTSSTSDYAWDEIEWSRTVLNRRMLLPPSRDGSMDRRLPCFAVTTISVESRSPLRSAQRPFASDRGVRMRYGADEVRARRALGIDVSATGSFWGG